MALAAYNRFIGTKSKEDEEGKKGKNTRGERSRAMEHSGSVDVLRQCRNCNCLKSQIKGFVIHRVASLPITLVGVQGLGK